MEDLSSQGIRSTVVYDTRTLQYIQPMLPASQGPQDTGIRDWIGRKNLKIKRGGDFIHGLARVETSFG